jgi:hypothetical protein
MSAEHSSPGSSKRKQPQNSVDSDAPRGELQPLRSAKKKKSAGSADCKSDNVSPGVDANERAGVWKSFRGRAFTPDERCVLSLGDAGDAAGGECRRWDACTDPVGVAIVSYLMAPLAQMAGLVGVVMAYVGTLERAFMEQALSENERKDIDILLGRITERRDLDSMQIMPWFYGAGIELIDTLVRRRWATRREIALGKKCCGYDCPTDGNCENASRVKDGDAVGGDSERKRESCADAWDDDSDGGGCLVRDPFLLRNYPREAVDQSLTATENLHVFKKPYPLIVYDSSHYRRQSSELAGAIANEVFVVARHGAPSDPFRYPHGVGISLRSPRYATDGSEPRRHPDLHQRVHFVPLEYQSVVLPSCDRASLTAEIKAYWNYARQTYRDFLRTNPSPDGLTLASSHSQPSTRVA